MTVTTTEQDVVGAAPAVTGFHHLGITVRDIDASEQWYGRVLGLVRGFVEPHSTGPGYAVVMAHPATGLFLGLDHHPGADGEPFSERRTGLDHVALQVTSREELDLWVEHLDQQGVEHGTIAERSEPVPHALVSFRDLDGIALELIWFGA